MAAAPMAVIKARSDPYLRKHSGSTRFWPHRLARELPHGAFVRPHRVNPYLRLFIPEADDFPMYKRITQLRRERFTIWLLVVGLGWFCPQAKAAAGTAPSNAPAASAVATNAAAIPLSEIAAQGESVSATLQAIDASVSADKTTQMVQQDLPVITQEISARLEENSRVLSRSPSLELLRKLSSEWQDVREEIVGWNRDLTRRANQLNGDIERLTQLGKVWDLTHDSVAKTNMPPEVSQKVDAVIAQIKQTRGNVETQQALILKLQSQVTEQDARVSQSLSAIDHAREDIVNHLFVKDSVPVWSIELHPSTAENLAQEGRHSFSRQFAALEAYAQRKQFRFFSQAALFLALMFIIFWVRRKLPAQIGEDSELKHAVLVFEVPVATALVLTLVASSWIYPQAPRLLWAILGAAALIPAAIVLRRVVSPALFPVLKALVAFYFVDQLCSVVAAPELLGRGLFLAEMLAAIVLIIWFLKRRLAGIANIQNRWCKAFAAALWIALFLFSAAFFANVFGYGILGKLLGNATLTSAYLGLILYAVIRIADGIILSVLSIPPVGGLRMVQRHRSFLQDRTRQVFEWAAVLLWAIYTLEAFSLRAPVFQDLKEILMVKLALGSISFSLGDVVLFWVTIWAAFMVSRVSRFVLEEEVYPTSIWRRDSIIPFPE
jgi:potassium-dependent mechanosensitive channel